MRMFSGRNLTKTFIYKNKKHPPKADAFEKKFITNGD